MRVGVLALQGDVREHVALFDSLGVESIRIRRHEDLGGIDALVLPGGESTTISLLLASSGIRPAVEKWVREDRPTLGTCAGLVLLADSISDGRADQTGIGGLAISVARNGYGRQKFSFEAEVESEIDEVPFHGVFIRAPKIMDVGNEATVLARLNGEPVAVQQGSILGCAFHPELAGDGRLHERLLSMVESRTKAL